MQREFSAEYRAFCLALPTAMLSALGWLSLGIASKEFMSDKGIVALLVLGSGATFAAVFVLAWLGFRGMTTAIEVLWVFALALLNGLTVGGIGAAFASQSVINTSTALASGAVAGLLGAAIAWLWVFAASRVEDSKLTAFRTCRNWGVVIGLTGFMGCGLAGLYLMGPGAMRQGAEQSQLTVDSPGSMAGGFGVFGIPALLGVLVFGYLGGLLGLVVGILRDLAAAAITSSGKGSRYTPAHLIEEATDRVVNALN